jgi:hypothetical protein
LCACACRTHRASSAARRAGHRSAAANQSPPRYRMHTHAHARAHTDTRTHPSTHRPVSSPGKANVSRPGADVAGVGPVPVQMRPLRVACCVAARCMWFCCTSHVVRGMLYCCTWHVVLLHVACCTLHVVLLHVACCFAARCMLHVACGFAARCMLHVACCFAACTSGSPVSSSNILSADGVMPGFSDAGLQRRPITKGRPDPLPPTARPTASLPSPPSLLSRARKRYAHGVRIRGIGVSGIGVSGVRISGIGVSGIGVSGIGVSGIGVSGNGKRCAHGVRIGRCVSSGFDRRSGWGVTY